MNFQSETTSAPWKGNISLAQGNALPFIHIFSRVLQGLDKNTQNTRMEQNPSGFNGIGGMALREQALFDHVSNTIDAASCILPIREINIKNISTIFC